MFHIISIIQDILLSNKQKKLHNLQYKDFRYHDRPTQLEEKIPFNYFVIDVPPENDSIITQKELDEVIETTITRNPETDKTILAIDKDPLVLYKAFLQNKIGFLEMSDIIEKCLETIPFLERPCMDDYVACDTETRKLALTLYK